MDTLAIVLSIEIGLNLIHFHHPKNTPSTNSLEKPLQDTKSEDKEPKDHSMALSRIETIAQIAATAQTTKDKFDVLPEQAAKGHKH